MATLSSVKSDICIEAQKVEFSFQKSGASSKPIKILDEVSLSVRQGEFVALYGEAGSGKSTLTRLFNALLLPTSGRIMIDGLDTRDEKNLWEIRRRVGMLFKETDDQIIGATVVEDVAFGPENLGWRPEIICNMVHDTLQIVGMLEYSDSAPRLLSRFQRLKVSLAGILAMQPTCIVIDESTTHLSRDERREIMAILRELNLKRGLTVILATQLTEELGYTDRSIILRDCRIVSKESSC